MACLVDELTQLVADCARACGRVRAMADATARALVAAEMAGLGGHGLSRVQLYAQHVKEGRASGSAEPRIAHEKGAACLIDAQGGLAYLAMELATREASRRAREFGVAFCGVTHSHHCGAMDYHLAPLAAAGSDRHRLYQLAGRDQCMGRQEAAVRHQSNCGGFPAQRNAAPLIVDLSLTEVARGKIMVAAKEGKPIPLGWALDTDGKPTTDAKAALTGSMAAIGGVKGVLLALIVELLCCALTGARFGFENDSFFEAGRPASIGHALLAIDPGALAGSDAYFERVETLIAAMLADEGVRLPGERRHKLAADARANGVAVPDALMKQLRELAG